MPDMFVSDGGSFARLKRKHNMNENESTMTALPGIALKLDQLEKAHKKLKVLMFANYFFSMGLGVAVAFLMLRLGEAVQLISEQAVVIHKILKAL